MFSSTFSLNRAASSCNSFFAPIEFVQLSDRKFVGRPGGDTIRKNAFRKESVSRPYAAKKTIIKLVRLGSRGGSSKA